jgi:hypothetical protein
MLRDGVRVGWTDPAPSSCGLPLYRPQKIVTHLEVSSRRSEAMPPHPWPNTFPSLLRLALFPAFG